ncbi:MAG: DUF2169 domain-containing protein [Polyangiaceae bacterium]
MEIVNGAGFPVEVATSIDKHGREHLLVVAKVSYRFGLDGALERLTEVDCPGIADEDELLGEPGLSAPLYEADLAPSKRRCDVILDATAHAPPGKEVRELDVSVRVGAMTKHLRVIGDRRWRRGVTGAGASSPEPFSRMRIEYGRAFGGRGATRDGADDAYPQNPVGSGWCSSARAPEVDGMRLPNIELPAETLTSPSQRVRPGGLGPLGRHWHPRLALAGTYDAAWRSDRFPLLPTDFDEAYFQCAPADQQIDFPAGGEHVVLHHLTEGRPLVQFELPRTGLSVKVLTHDRRATEIAAVVDTVFIRPDDRLLSLVYRASAPLDRRGLVSLRVVATGPVCKKWWRAVAFGTSDCGCKGMGEEDGAEDGDTGASEVSPEPLPGGDGA